MKKLLTIAMYCISYMLIIVFLGMFIPLLISTFISLFTTTTFEQCITCTPFWFFCVIGWMFVSIIFDKCFKK